MAKLTVAEEFDVALKLAARDADSKTPSRLVAEDFYRSEPRLVEQFSRDWIIEKLTSLIGRQRTALRRANDPQMSLGFVVPKTIVVGEGERIAFGDATLRKLRLYRAKLWNEKRSDKPKAIQNLDQAIALLKRYASTEKGITYSEAVARELRKR